MQKSNMMVRTYRLPIDVLNRYQKLADTTGRTVSFYIRLAAEQAIDHLEVTYQQHIMDTNLKK